MTANVHQPEPGSSERRTFLMVQGPLSPLYARIGDKLRHAGHHVWRINLSIGDWLHWRRPGAFNFRGRASAFPAFVSEIIAAKGISDVVLHGECRLYHRMAADAARQHGARVFVTELGYLRPDWMTVDRDGTAAGSSFPRNAAAIAAIAARSVPIDLTPQYRNYFFWVAAPDVAYNMANTLLWFLYPHYQRHTIDWPPLEYTAALARLVRERARNARADRAIVDLVEGGRPFFVFALQLEGDFQVRARSPFSSQAEAIELAASSFKAHAPGDTCLVLKTHPLDNGLRNWRRVVDDVIRRHGLDGRLILLDGGRLAPMLANARGLVTINSSAGLEAILAGLPTKPLAPALYDVVGLTHGGPLDTFWPAPTAPDAGLATTFVRALAGSVQVRGTIYSRQGFAAAVDNITAALLTDRPGRMTRVGGGAPGRSSNSDGLSSAPPL